MITRFERSLVGLLVLAASASVVDAGVAQTVVEEWHPARGYLRIGPEPERRIRMAERGFTLLLPVERAAVGTVVFIDSRRFLEWNRPEAGSFDARALEQGLAVLHITTGNPLDFLFDKEDVQGLATRIQKVLAGNGLADRSVHFAGLSLGGTRALRLVLYLQRAGTEHGLRPGAVAVVDAPLDMERLWRSEGHSIRNGYPVAADEGRWVRYLLESHLGGPPGAARNRYVEYSPFAYTEPGGGNASGLRSVPLRAYHEPDVEWWLENRGKSYYDMNSLDLAALIAELRSAGNERASLVTTYGQREGFEDGASPHTWSFVDNQDLASWFATNSRPSAYSR